VTLESDWLGTRATGGYGVRVLDVQIPRGWQPVVRYAEITPKFGSIATQVMTSPFLIIRLPREAGMPILQRLPGSPF